MGYITTALTPAERAKAGPKNGANTSATVAVDALGSVSVMIDSVPQGQAFEYQVERVTQNFYGTVDGTAYGYVYAGNRLAASGSGVSSVQAVLVRAFR